MLSQGSCRVSPVHWRQRVLIGHSEASVPRRGNLAPGQMLAVGLACLVPPAYHDGRGSPLHRGKQTSIEFGRVRSASRRSYSMCGSI